MEGKYFNFLQNNFKLSKPPQFMETKKKKGEKIRTFEFGFKYKAVVFSFYFEL